MLVRMSSYGPHLVFNSENYSESIMNTFISLMKIAKTTEIARPIGTKEVYHIYHT